MGIGKFGEFIITTMRNTFCAMVLAGLMPFFCSGQVVSGLRPDANSEMGQYTEWQTADVTFDDGTTAQIAYRIALVDRKGIGCHYDVEVSNKSDMKLDIVLEASYYDKLVKGNFMDESKESLKPGKGVVVRSVAQGCKATKGEEKSDFETCMACEYGVSIRVFK